MYEASVNNCKLDGSLAIRKRTTSVLFASACCLWGFPCGSQHSSIVMPLTWTSMTWIILQYCTDLKRAPIATHSPGVLKIHYLVTRPSVTSWRLSSSSLSLSVCRPTLRHTADQRTWLHCSIWMNPVWWTAWGSAMEATSFTPTLEPIWWSSTPLAHPPCTLRR